MVSYALDHAVGGEDPFVYHRTNLVLHAVNGILLLLLLEALFARRALSLAGALLFVLHPIRTEAVASIVGRAESLSGLFVLLAWLVYARSRRGGRGALAWAAALALGLGALTKESSVAFVALLPLTDGLVGAGALRERFAPRALVVRYLPFAVALALVAAARVAVLGGLAPLAVHPSSNPLVHAAPLVRFLTATHVFARYVWLLVFPLDLSADYSYNAIPLVTSLVSVRALVPLALLIGLVGGTFACFRRAPFLFFCGWTFLALFVPTSNWFKVIGTLMAERLMYLPSIGFTCALAWLLVRGLDTPRWRTAAAVVSIALATLYGARTVERNRDWRDHFSLFASAVEVVPGSGLAQANLASILLQERNDPRRAIEHARRAVAIDPGDAASHYTLGEACRRLGERAAAVAALDQVVRLAPRTKGGVAALRAVIALREESSRFEEAAASAALLVDWRPRDASAHLILARLERLAGHSERAREVLARAVELAPDDPAVRSALEAVSR